jgi:serine protease Do
VAYNRKKIDESSTLPALVASTPVGQTVPVEVVRNGKTKTLEVTVSKLAEKEMTNADESTAQKGKWGLALRELRPEEREQMNLKEDEGVLIGDVAPDSPAAEAGLEAGDVILEVNHTPVASVTELKKEIGKAEGDKPLLLLLRRSDGNNQFASLTAK